MANIILTNYCNLKCPYCFFKQTAAKKQLLSIKNLSKIIKFLKKSKINSVGILGGEPTLHPQFNSLIRIIGKNFPFWGLFTNGIIYDSGKIKLLQSFKSENMSVVLNINNRQSYTKDDWRAVCRTLRALSEKVILGYNIYRREFKLKFIFDLINAYGLQRRIRLGIAHPSVHSDNAFLSRSDYQKISRKIVSFAKECDRNNVSLRLDCGFVLCMFTEKELGILYKCNTDIKFVCTEVLDIGPDLTVRRCFGLSNIHTVNLLDFNTTNEITDHYSKAFRLYSKVGSTAKCFHCKYLARQQCAGGCLAETMLAVTPLRQKNI